MKNLFIVLLLTMSSTAYCNGSWTPEDIRQGLSADILKDSGKLNSVVDNIDNVDNLQEAEEIVTTDTPEEEEIITGYNVAMFKYSEILRSIKGRFLGVDSALVAFQKYNLLSEETCISKLTDDVLMDALDKIVAYDFPGSNGPENATIVTALLDSYRCNVDKASEKYKATKVINAIVEYIPVRETYKAREDILNYVKNTSAVDYVTAVVDTIFLAQHYGILDDSICMPEEWTIEMTGTLNELDTGDFPKTNVGGVEYIYFTLYEKYHC